MKVSKLVGPDNPKLKLVVHYTDLKRAVATGNALVSYVKKVGALGLSANQAGIMERVCVIKMGSTFRIFIDPHLGYRSTKTISSREGSLSHPGVTGLVDRPQSLWLTWKEVEDWQIKKIKAKFEGLDAIRIEHMIDSLDGIRFIDKAKDIKERD